MSLSKIKMKFSTKNSIIQFNEISESSSLFQLYNYKFSF
jgi:hypothetical protein